MASINDVSVKTVTLGDLRTASKKGGIGEFYIVLPKFQRGVVWTSKQKEQLIDSIYTGFPIGSLLAYRTGGKDSSGEKDRDIYELVDGLQRTTTIIEYLDQPLTLAGVDSLIESEKLTLLCQLCWENHTEANLLELKSALTKWFQVVKRTDTEDGFYAAHLKESLIVDLTTAINLREKLSTFEAETFISQLLGVINKLISDIEKASIPIIVYIGKEENVPEIFDRINSQGIKLSKYEKFAASWMSFTIDIENQEIKNKITAKYKSLIARGYQVAELDEDWNGQLNSFNLFEYLFGLGKFLGDKFDNLFQDSGGDEDPIPAAFVLTTIAHGLKIADMGKLAVHLKATSSTSGVITLLNFETALIQSCSDVQKELRKYVQVNLNKQSSNSRFLPHSMNQIYSLITRYMIEKYDPESNWVIRPNNKALSLLKNIPSFYLFDVLQGSWAGSGDTKLWEVCWHEDETTGVRTRNDHYLNRPTHEDWTQVLDLWNSRELQKNQVKRPSISSESKLFLKYVYSDVVTVMHNEGILFDIEHLHSVASISTAIEASISKEGWPISAIGNLALLDQKVNRKKGTMMLGDFKKSPKGREFNEDEWQAIQKYVIQPSVEELISSMDLKKDVYLDFCKRRYKVLTANVLSKLIDDSN